MRCKSKEIQQVNVGVGRQEMKTGKTKFYRCTKLTEIAKENFLIVNIDAVSIGKSRHTMIALKKV